MQNFSIRIFSILATMTLSSVSFSGTDWQDVPQNVPAQPPSPFTHTSPPVELHWWTGADFGLSRTWLDNAYWITNANHTETDQYFTKNGSTGFVDLSIGGIWQRTSQWMPAYSVAFRYRYLPKTNIGSHIDRFENPLFNDYNYQTKVSTQTTTLQGKLDFYQYEMIMPYISGGIGVAFNRMTQVNETPIAGIPVRQTPGYPQNANNTFTYNLGAGLDFPFTPSFIGYIGYEYQHLGSVYSGYGDGTGPWANARLYISNFRTNNILIGFNCLFG